MNTFNDHFLNYQSIIISKRVIHLSKEEYLFDYEDDVILEVNVRGV